MGGSIFVPVLIGFAVNAALFLVTRYVIKRDFRHATRLTLIAAMIAFIISFFVSGWQGMGIGIISLGMLSCTLILYVVSFTKK